LDSKSKRLIGKSLPRKEDHRLITGRGVYTDDVRLPDMLYATFLRSHYAHARITAIDTAGGSKVPGVVAILTGKDIANVTAPFPYHFQFVGVNYPRQFPLAVDKVRFVGEPVACVLTTDPQIGQDCLEQINVEYEPLPALLDPKKAMESRLLIHDGIGDNLFASRKLEKGNVEDAFKSAHKILRETFKIQRHTGSPIEPHGIVANYDPIDDSLTVWAATQIPTGLQFALSTALRIPQNRIRVIAKDVGGGFGNYKYHPEDIAVCLLSMKFKKPVKWVGTRSEIFLAGYHARDQVHQVEVAIDARGRILALKDKFFASMGAFLPRETIAPPNTTFVLLPGPYKIDNLSLEMYCVAVNMAPSGAYRGFGMPEANFVIERVMDFIAKESGLSPSEVRLRNLIRPEDLPYTSQTGVVYDTGNYPLLLAKVLESTHNEGSSPSKKSRQQSENETHKKGVGLAFYTEVTGFGPGRTTSMTGAIYGGSESVTIRVDSTGTVTILTGLMPHGQGSETTLAQVASDFLGVGMDDIKVIYGDTEKCPYGPGTFGSRGAVVGSGAVSKAAESIVNKGKKIASSMLQIKESDVEFEEGVFRAKGASNKAVSFKEVARAANFGINLPKDVDPGFEATVVFDPTEWTMAYGAHISVVEVDLETGVIRVPRYYVVHDCGRILNPMIVEGQIHGGVAQGLGGAVIEQLVYDADGQLLTSTFMDYLVPTSLETPQFRVEHMETPSAFNPLGVKGVGEGGIIPVAAAIASAVEDALADYGVRVTETPLTPERVWLLANSKPGANLSSKP
jgi:carbon-monoxide dehydrogenase large subunit